MHLIMAHPHLLRVLIGFGVVVLCSLCVCSNKGAVLVVSGVGRGELGVAFF